MHCRAARGRRRHPTGGIFTDDQKDISSYGIEFDTRWVTVHDTSVDHSGLAFDANALAKAAGATPLKRPENGVFRPGTGFREFFFETTGDTNATSDANAGVRRLGRRYRLVQSGPSADRGKLRLLFQGDQAHTGLDNVTFIDGDHVAYVEDAGSTLHVQRNALDSAYLFDVRADYSHGRQPTRFIAEGRDEAATLDAMLAGRRQRVQQRGRQRDHRHPHVRRRSDPGRHSRREGPAAVPRRLAALLDPATRTERHVGNRPQPMRSTMHRTRLTRLAAAAAAGLATLTVLSLPASASGSSADSGEGYTFAVIGDIPYGGSPCIGAAPGAQLCQGSLHVLKYRWRNRAGLVASNAGVTHTAL